MNSYYLSDTNKNFSLLTFHYPISLDFMHYFLDCDFIECVYTPYLRDLVMVIDESGKLKDKPINILASSLYPGFEYGDPIVGNVLFMKRSGADLVSLDDYQIRILRKIASDLYYEVKP